MQSIDRIHRYGTDSDGQIICATIPTNIEIVYCPNTIDDVVDDNLTRKRRRMYEWLNDPSLIPCLNALTPNISHEEIEKILNPSIMESSDVLQIEAIE